MAIGFGVLQLSSKAFWALTPKEFEAAMRGRFGAPKGGAGLTTADLAQLMQQFPDAATD